MTQSTPQVFYPELAPMADPRPGQGQFLLHGADCAVNSAVRLAIQRNQDENYLSTSGPTNKAAVWVSGETWIELRVTSAEHGVAAIHVDDATLDALLVDSTMFYQLTLLCGQDCYVGSLTILPGLLSSDASGAPPAAFVAELQPAIPAAEPSFQPEIKTEVKAEVKPEAKTEPNLRPTPPPRKKGMLWAAIGALGLILVAGGLAFWWWLPASSNGADQAIAPCGQAAIKASADDIAFIQSCLKSSPSSEGVLETIAAAESAGRCDLVQRLYAYKAQEGDAVVAMAYAHEFDPDTHKAGCIAAADSDTAVYWYEMALSHDAGNQEAQARIKALKK